MEAFIERIIQEKKELDEKKTKLGEFINSPKATELDVLQFRLLNVQYSTMQSYSDILRTRLELLKKD